jgi:hypothetical protein
MLTHKDLAKTQFPSAAQPTPARAAVDELLLQDAFNLQKPILAICHGTQTLNVWRNGTLIQDITDPGESSPRARGRANAHPARITPGSRLSRLVPLRRRDPSRRSTPATTRPSGSHGRQPARRCRLPARWRHRSRRARLRLRTSLSACSGIQSAPTRRVHSRGPSSRHLPRRLRRGHPRLSSIP